MTDYDFVAAFVVGLMGAAHCFGMCGGLMAALSSNTPQKIQVGENLLLKQLKLLFSYNIGRVLSYTTAGVILGGAAASLKGLFSIDHYLIILRIFAGIMMLVTGLYLSSIWQGLTKIEKIGNYFWQYLKPIATKLLPIKTVPKALIAGIVWGWLPCGLVYSTLTWSVASGSAIKGGLIMFAFGLGTMPALLSIGVASRTISSWVQKRKVRLLSGLLVASFGVHTLWIAFNQL
ncbi:sulfite exporter TauE/SafE family protein [Parashewanella curva]|uniref:Sulfite exporter TauE/SafE family protein n=1 Tax=Parashewanella curva TaxID=2338552 RepID=A0A3L8PS15_9GAMM|nr:sulfite exporter TauE/SafE family protein [Parashewanella curva]RLV58185.1 sulfite exporter TauE/SafE family protein [Parashewanella curva]